MDLWLQTLPLEFSVKNFVNEVKVWTSKGYLDVGVWKHLQNYVTPDVLPSYSEMSHMRRASRLSMSEPPIGVLSVLSGTIPGPGGKQILNTLEEVLSFNFNAKKCQCQLEHFQLKW